MSFGGWKLSAAVSVLILSSNTAYAQKFIDDPNFARAIFCSRIAALSVADQESESSQTVARYGISRCDEEISKAKGSFRKLAKARKIELEKWAMDEQFDEMLLSDIGNFVIQARGLAKKRGPLIYRSLAEVMQEKYDCYLNKKSGCQTGK